MTPRRSLDLRAPAVTAVALAALGLVPLLVRREDVLNLGVVFLLSVALAQGWNVVAGRPGLGGDELQGEYFRLPLLKKKRPHFLAARGKNEKDPKSVSRASHPLPRAL